MQSIFDLNLVEIVFTYGWQGLAVGVIPLIAKYGYGLLKKYTDNRDKVLYEIKDAIEVAFGGLNDNITEVGAKYEAVIGSFDEQHRVMLNKLESIIMSSNGELTETQIMAIVKNYIGKVNLRLILWWRERVASNNIDKSLNLVHRRYSEKLTILTSKWNGELALFKYDHRSLTQWNTDSAIYYYYKEILSDLFNIQLSVSKGEEPLYQPDNIKDYIDRKQDELMGAIREWCTDHVTLSEYVDKNHLKDETSRNITWM
jgi:hypothetical protein